MKKSINRWNCRIEKSPKLEGRNLQAGRRRIFRLHQYHFQFQFSYHQYHFNFNFFIINIIFNFNSFLSSISFFNWTLVTMAEVQKPKTFRIAAFHAQNCSGRGAWLHISQHVKSVSGAISTKYLFIYHNIKSE